MIKPTEWQAWHYKPEWYDTDFFYSPDGVKEFPEHHCKMSWVMSKPYITETRQALDIGCRDGEYTRYLSNTFDHTYCFDPRLRWRFAYNCVQDRVTHYNCKAGIDLQIDDLQLKHIDYMKLDVDGHEVPIVKGSEATIKEYKPIVVIEVEREAQREAQAILEAWDYKVVEVDARDMDRLMLHKTHKFFA